VIERTEVAHQARITDVAAPEPSDKSLLRRLREGDQDAAEWVYRRYAKRLRALVQSRRHACMARRVDPDDVVQSALRGFFRRAARGCYEVPDGAELWSLFLRITLNKLRSAGMYHCAARRDARRTVGDDDLGAVPTAREAPAFLKLTVEEALDRLPAAHREMVELRIEGYAVAEIAERTGLAKRKVERLLQEARERLGGLLDAGD
jgi:RNA polymerase sigma-70 factor (ECF subfamily)